MRDAGATKAGGAGQAKKSAASPTAKVLLSLGVPASVKLNEQFNVQVNAAQAQNLYGAVYTVSYDPKSLEVVTQSEGPFLKQDGAQTGMQAFADKKKGELWISQSRANTTEGVGGSGALATVTFKALGKGTLAIALGNTNFVTRNGDQIPVTSFKSVVEVK